MLEESVEVRTEGDRLIVRGERPGPGPHRPERFHRMERGHGPFSRTFHLGDAVDAERIDAHLQDGILRLTLPKRRGRAARRGRPDRPV